MIKLNNIIFVNSGALYGGLLAAGAVLERNVLRDLMSFHKKNKKSKIKDD